MSIYTLLNSVHIKNIEYLDIYVKYISDNSTTPQLNCEAHHILPKSMFPEYKNFKKYSWNRCNLSAASHLYAHWLLYKLYDNKEMTHAFRMMVERKIDITTLTESDIILISKEYEIAKLKSNEYLSNLIKSKIRITNGVHDMYIDKNSEIPYGYRIGRIPAIAKGERIWIYNSENNSQKRINKSELNYYTSIGYTIEYPSSKNYTNGIVQIKLSENSTIPDGFVIGHLHNFYKRKSNSIGVPSKRKGKKYFINVFGDKFFGYKNDVPEGYTPIEGYGNNRTLNWLPYFSSTKYKNYHDKNTKCNIRLPDFISPDINWVSGFYSDKKIKNETRIHIHNPNTNEKLMILSNADVPNGFVIGRGKLIKKSDIKLHWYNNGILNAKIKLGDEIPLGYVKGQLKNSRNGSHNKNYGVKYYYNSELNIVKSFHVGEEEF